MKSCGVNDRNNLNGLVLNLGSLFEDLYDELMDNVLGKYRKEIFRNVRKKKYELNKDIINV